MWLSRSSIIFLVRSGYPLGKEMDVHSANLWWKLARVSLMVITQFLLLQMVFALLKIWYLDVFYHSNVVIDEVVLFK